VTAEARGRWLGAALPPLPPAPLLLPPEVLKTLDPKRRTTHEGGRRRTTHTPATRQRTRMTVGRGRAGKEEEDARDGAL